MKEMLEEYGGLLLGVLLAGILVLFSIWCLKEGGPLEVLAKVFAEITFGS